MLTAILREKKKEMWDILEQLQEKKKKQASIEMSLCIIVVCGLSSSDPVAAAKILQKRGSLTLMCFD